MKIKTTNPINSRKMKEYWKNGRATENQIRTFLHERTPANPEKLRLAMQRRKEKYGYINSMKTRKKISDSIKQMWRDGNISEKQEQTLFKKGFDDKRNNKQFKKGHSVPKEWKDKIKLSKIGMRKQIKDTSIEIKIQNFLKELGIGFFTHQKLFESDGRYRCDIFIPVQKSKDFFIKQPIVIECDGNYWHKYPVGNDLDHIRTSELIKKGFKVLRLWESEIKTMDLNKFKEKTNAIF